MATFVAETGHRIDKGCVGWTGTEWKVVPENSFSSPGIPQDDQHPAVCVNWTDAKAYVAWLARRTGRPYRLPSEAEWEFAVRGVTQPTVKQPIYFFGNDVAQLGTYAWYHESAGRGTHAVGLRRATAWGMHDLVGNAREWLDDCWHASYAGHPATGQSWTTGCVGTELDKSVRGGGWPHLAKLMRSAHRGTVPQAQRHNDLGLRVVRSLAAE